MDEQVATFSAVLGLPPLVVWDTPFTMLELMVAAKAKANGKSFSRHLLPHEQETKVQGQEFARRLEASLAAKP